MCELHCEEGDRARKGGVISSPCFLYRSLAHFFAGAPSFRPPAAASGDHRERGMDDGREPWKHGGRGEVFSSNKGSLFSQLFSVRWFACLQACYLSEAQQLLQAIAAVEGEAKAAQREGRGHT